MSFNLRRAGGGVAAVALTLGLGASAPSHAGERGDDVACAASFDAAVRQYVDATQQRDLDRYAEVLHPGWTVIFPDGDVLNGKEEGMEWVRGFFADSTWTQSFEERSRVQSGCRTGFVLFDSVFRIPSENYRSDLVIGLTFTREGDRWLVIHDQNTSAPSTSG